MLPALATVAVAGRRCIIVTHFNDDHTAQMLGYLNITELRLALLLNFKRARLQWKRLVQ